MAELIGTATVIAHPIAPKNRSGFEIAIIYATKVEADAVEVTFDKVWDHKYKRAPGDTNAYTIGVIGDHNTVLAYMPGIGKGAAGKVAGSFCSSFTGIRLALLVGICGGVPSGGADTRNSYSAMWLSPMVSFNMTLVAGCRATSNGRIPSMTILGDQIWRSEHIWKNSRAGWVRKRLRTI